MNPDLDMRGARWRPERKGERFPSPDRTGERADRGHVAVAIEDVEHLPVGVKEAEERKLALRRFGSQAQEIVLLSDAAKFLAEEALPPDLKRAKEAAQANG